LLVSDHDSRAHTFDPPREYRRRSRGVQDARHRTNQLRRPEGLDQLEPAWQDQRYPVALLDPSSLKRCAPDGGTIRQLAERHTLTAERICKATRIVTRALEQRIAK
jgi:hypothetical protein